MSTPLPPPSPHANPGAASASTHAELLALIDRLKHSESQFQALLDNSPAPAWITDEDGLVLYMSDTYYRTFQTPGPSLVGKSPYDFAPRHLADFWVANIRKAAASGQIVSDMEPSFRANGTPGRFLIYKFLLPGTTPAGKKLVGGVAVDITERLAAESALQESEQRFAFVARALNDGIWEWDPATHHLWWSPRNFEILGYAPDEIVPTPDWFTSQVHPDDRDRLWNAIADHLAGKSDEYRCEFRIKSKRGEYCWLSARGKALRDAQNQATRVIGAQYDITEHKRATIALAESREQLSLAVDGAGLGTFYCTFPLDKIFWNDTCKDHFFLPHDADIDFELFYSRLHPDDREPTRRAIEHAQNDHVPYNVQYRTVAPDGRQRWINAVGRFYYQPDGTPRRFDGITIDITEQKDAQLALRDSEERYRFLADNIPQIAWTAAADGSVEGLNRRWYDYTGFDPSQPLPPRDELTHYIHPDDLPLANETWATALRAGEQRTVEYRLRRHDGAYRWFLAQAAPMRDADGRIVRWFGTCTDIDDFKQAQAHNVELLREARHASAAKDRFLAVLSHELRTPLNPALMALSALERDDTLPLHARADLAMIRRNIDLETQLIDDLLDITRITHGKIHLAPRPINLNELLDHVCGMVKREADARRIRLDCHFDADPDHVHADPGRLEQVFWNLLKNAVKFTPDGGTITFASSNSADGVVVSIHDTGIGIEPAALARIFNPFEQGEQTITRQFGGLGLGLAIAKAIVELHQGAIWAESPGKDRGATFFVRLPVHEQQSLSPSPSTDPLARALVSPSERPIHILLVDDHQDTLAVTRRILAALGYQVTAAPSVSAARQLLASAPFDILISDIGLPDGSGFDVIATAKQHLPHLRSIALSGFGMEDDIRRSLDAGFDAHLTKPISLDRLCELLASLHPST